MTHAIHVDTYIHVWHYMMSKSAINSSDVLPFCRYESSEGNMTISCSTKVCSFGRPERLNKLFIVDKRLIIFVSGLAHVVAPAIIIVSIVSANPLVISGAIILQGTKALVLV